MTKKLTKCCNVPTKMTNRERGLQSNVQFMVCSKCGKGDLWRLEGIEIKDLVKEL